MKKMYSTIVVFFVLVFVGQNIYAQGVTIGPRITGNLNIYNQKGLTGSWNGIGVGVGGTVDASFSSHIGLMTNLTFFDMRGFSNSSTTQGVTVENSQSISYLAIDPMFKAQFSGFYMTAGPSLGVKISSSGEVTQVATGQQPVVQATSFETKSVVFNIALGTGYTFNLSPGMYMGTDFMVYIPISDTFNFPGLSNSIFSLKLGVALKFSL